MVQICESGTMPLHEIKLSPKTKMAMPGVKLPCKQKAVDSNAVSGIRA